jgi:multiple sugar transport system permease protein
METTTKLRTGAGWTVRRNYAKWLLNGWLLAMSALMVVPFVWMILSAFKPASELLRPIPNFFPEAWTLRSFSRIFVLFPFQRFFLNSFIVTTATVAIILFTSSLLGFVFGKFRFPGSRVLFLLIISSMIIPFEVRVIPMFLIIRGLNWVNTYQALIVPFIVDAFGVYLFREFIRTIPSDYLDAARIDGASEWRIYQRVVLPLTTSVMSALAIFAFVYYWDMLIWPLVAVSSQEMKTLPVGMLLLTNQRGGIYDLLLAAGLLGVVPNLIMFLIFQRQIVKGVILAGLKG